MIYFFLATGVRREELVNLNLDQVQPSVPAGVTLSNRVKHTLRLESWFTMAVFAARRYKSSSLAF
jgi:hypothetical protein